MRVEEINDIATEMHTALDAVRSAAELEAFRLHYLSKKGVFSAFMERLKEVPKEDKPAFGKVINEVRNAVQTRFAELQEAMAEKARTTPSIDLSLPGRIPAAGHRHPVSAVIEELTKTFESLGFSAAVGPEIEDDAHNFGMLNFPDDHPARDMQDTFFVNPAEKTLLRTHTSSVQVRLMEAQKPPIRSIMVGRVYRNEALDATHLAEFHQMEGLYVDKGVTFAELKATLLEFVRKLYGNDVELRFRASFFPFTEPSAELDIRRRLPDGSYSKWMEVCGCGMVHPNVLKACGIDPEVYSGFAFGMGIERIAMLRTRLADIRMLYQNDVRMLHQF